MRLRFTHVAAAAALVAGAGLACTPSAGGSADASADHVGIVPVAEAGEDDAGGDAQGGTQTTLRLANMSPDLGAIDFCWRVAGSATFTGPVLGGSLDAGAPDGETQEAGAPEPGAEASAGADAASDATEPEDATLDGATAAESGADAADAGADAGDASASTDAAVADASPPEPPVAFTSMSAAVTLPTSGTLDIALVAAGQLSCGAPVAVRTITLDAGKITTLTVMGLARADAGSASSLSMVAFTDELADPATAKVRFVHAALGWPGDQEPAPPLSVRAGATVLAPDVQPGHVTTMAAMPPVDALGFASISPLAGETVLTVSAMADGSAHAWSTRFVSIDALPGTVHTGFVVSSRAGALGIAWCGAGPAVGVPTCRLWTAE